MSGEPWTEAWSAPSTGWAARLAPDSPTEYPDMKYIAHGSGGDADCMTLAEGPLVEEITPDGAVLNFRGSRFKLSND